MTTRHTPGPWVIGDTRGLFADGIPVKAYCKPYDNELAIFNLPNNNLFGGRDTTIANAYLIAAAPEMLEACKWAYLACHESDKVTLEKLCNAIAKAEGKTDDN